MEGRIVILSLLFSSRYLELGLETIEISLDGGAILGGAFLLKMLFTAITLSFGGSGGIVTPIFFVGATAGSTRGRMLGFDPSLLAAVGMVGLLAGCANTPISAGIMAIELFGPQIAPYAAVACMVSFLMTGHLSVYSSQVLSLAKSSPLSVAKGSEMREMSSFNPGREASAAEL
jgi:H+/Cl- antiporter ClcA